MEHYDHKKIEKKWQDKWEKDDLYKVTDSQNKKYILDMFPYPSGDGLHVGHVEGYTATDVYSRYLRSKGHNVLHPMGWDAFGLPAENFAIKTGIHPEKTTKEASDNFRRQIKSLGLSYDWSREIDTHTPEYYKWTQWLFLKLFEEGLAYKKKAKVNWCESCKTVLANEQVVNGECERCGDEVVQKDLEQWFFKITDYADALIDDLDTVDWPQSTILNQKNWIGRSEGAELSFAIKDSDETIDVFTTRPDTLYGATYMVLAPEHALVSVLKDKIENGDEVEKYIEETGKKTEIERTAEGKEKTGVLLKGVSAINPATKEEIPIFIADYVLAGYGTGAIMAVPAHDERDNAFAKKFDLPITCVVEPHTGSPQENPKEKKKIVALVEHDEKILTIHWKPELGGRLFVGGTGEEGEEPEVTAKREILEETGYADLELVEKAEERVHHEYFAHSKRQAFIARTTILHFKLNSEKQEETSLEEDEKGKFEVEWVPIKQAEQEVTDPLHKYAFRKFLFGECYTGEGQLINSGEFDGASTEEARAKITQAAGGEMKTTFKLRDWLVSRQRYWGVPIPIAYDKDGKAHPVPEEHLPWLLPTDVEFKPTGISPLADSKELKERVEKVFGPGFTPEIDTMDTFVCSSWYYLRFTDPHNEKAFADKKELDTWLPVDMYVGGAEHTVLHLMYARFITKFLQKLGFVSVSEPFQKLRHQGMVLAEDGRKMSKSLGNVVNPDEVIENIGADALRMYEMFMGPFDQAIPWSTNNMVGARRFLERVWRAQELISETSDSDEVLSLLHKTIKKVGEDIESMKFNTAVSSLMVLLNGIEDAKTVSKETYVTLLQLLAPFAPHITEELHVGVGGEGSIHTKEWPAYDEALTKVSTVTIAVQVNGKVRGTFEAPVDTEKDEILRMALEIPKVKDYVEGKNMAKTIHIPNKLLNIVV